MLTDFFLFLCNRSPAFRRLMWRLWYDYLGARFQNRDWTFMNYGYEPDDPAGRPALSPDEEPDRRCIQLYHHLASAVPLAGRTLVEVGSGRGGGCAWVHRNHALKKTRGVDFSGKAVALCRRRHRAKGLSFVRGDAENLPLRDGRVDAVINVESSHCYGSRENFIRQVGRVLRPGGYFLYTDFFTEEEVADVKKYFATEGLETVRECDITANVVRALELDHDAKRRRIREIVPEFLAPSFEQFAGLKDSEIHEAFVTRRLTYHSFVLRKPA